MNHNWKWIFLGALFIGGGLSIFASSSPDGLMKVAEDQRFAQQSAQHSRGILPAYHVPGIGNHDLSTSLSGLIGVMAVFVILFGVSHYLFPSAPVGGEKVSSIRETIHK